MRLDISGHTATQEPQPPRWSFKSGETMWFLREGGPRGICIPRFPKTPYYSLRLPKFPKASLGLPTPREPRSLQNPIKRAGSVQVDRDAQCYPPSTFLGLVSSQPHFVPGFWEPILMAYGGEPDPFVIRPELSTLTGIRCATVHDSLLSLLWRRILPKRPKP